MSDVKVNPICGIIMPISFCDGCPDTHWIDVRNIITASINDAGFNANLVSQADDVGVIHKTIIQNLYENPIVVCDVSGKNPNVMFELGLRLAFDKPTIIIKDDKTAYSFDTSVIEHITYPRDLRFNSIENFKSNLILKIQSTHAKSISDPSYTTFLKHFGAFTVAKIERTEVPAQEFILEELSRIGNTLKSFEINQITREQEIVKDIINITKREKMDDWLNFTAMQRHSPNNANSGNGLINSNRSNTNPKKFNDAELRNMLRDEIIK